MTPRAGSAGAPRTGSRAIAVLAGIAVAVTLGAPGRTAAAEAPTDGEMLALVQKHCVPCHAAEPTHPAFAKPPAGIRLETMPDIVRNAAKILTQVTVTEAMPLGNETDMTAEERRQIAAWIESRK